MNRTRLLVAAAILAALAVSPALAQTPANITIVSGDGQLALPCGGAFQPMTAQVTDANGVPVAGTTVSWAITASSGGTLLGGTATTTDANGMTNNTYTGFSVQAGGVGSLVVDDTFTASITTRSVTFHLVQEKEDLTNQQNLCATPLTVSATSLPLSGQVGTTGSTPITVTVSARGVPVPNVSVQLVTFDPANPNVPSTGPVVNCAGVGLNQPGISSPVALTGATGTATCTPVFSGAPGNVQYYILTGAGGIVPVDPTVKPPSSAFSLQASLTLTAAPAGLIKTISGNNQSANPGQNLPAPLVAEVDTTAGAPLSGATVNWTVSPAGAASLYNTTTSTSSSGQVSTGVTLASNASGTVQVTATCPSCTGAHSVTYTVTVVPVVTVSGVSIVSGNNQTAIVNAAFGSPLVVQVNTTAGPAANVPVSFSVSGPATLSATSATTGSNGQAQVSVTAGATPGAVTVTATAAGFSQSFNLTVSPAGPSITAASFVNAADFQVGSLSPCSLATIFASGLAPGLQGMVVSLPPGGWQYTLAGDQVLVNGQAAPIYFVSNQNGQEELTFQVPCDAPGGTVPIKVNVGAGTATAEVNIQAASPGLFLRALSGGQTMAAVLRPDGTWVSPSNPARRGETLVAFATGLGPSDQSIATNALPVPGSSASPTSQIIVGMAGAGVPFISANLSPDLIGVWEVTFQVPGSAPSGNNVTFSISVVPAGSTTPISSGTTSIPVQ